MLRGTCLSCYRFYSRASTAFTNPSAGLPDVTSSCDGKRCVARSSTTVTVPRSACNGGCRRPPARRVVATAAVAASAAAAAEIERRRTAQRGGWNNNGMVTRFGSAFTEGRASRGPRTGGLSRSPPPMFGSSVPTVGTLAGSSGTATRPIHSDVVGGGAIQKPKPPAEERDDCPICKKYSRGPCGDLFKSWLKCADDHPGKDDDTGEDLHLSKCERFAMPLARCLEDNDEYYSGPLDEVRDDEHTAAAATAHRGEKEREGRELRRAWSGLVDDLEHPKENRAALPFPNDIKPEMEVRLTNMEGMAAFAPRDERGEELILAYVKDQEGELLGAGSSEDVRSGGGIMRFGVRDVTREVTACALYGGEDGSPIYKRTQVLPPQAKDNRGEKR